MRKGIRCPDAVRSATLSLLSAVLTASHHPYTRFDPVGPSIRGQSSRGRGCSCCHPPPRVRHWSSAPAVHARSSPDPTRVALLTARHVAGHPAQPHLKASTRQACMHACIHGDELGSSSSSAQETEIRSDPRGDDMMAALLMRSLTALPRPRPSYSFVPAILHACIPERSGIGKMASAHRILRCCCRTRAGLRAEGWQC
jgi:hypothetical protein